MAKIKPLKIGSKVTYHYWTEGELRSAPATVADVFEPDGESQALALAVDFPEAVMEREGYAREQSHARQRTREENDVHASGTWSS